MIKEKWKYTLKSLKSNKKKLLPCVLAAVIVSNNVALAKEFEIYNTQPNASLSATVVHPKKLDIVLMTDYTGTKKSTLLSAVNNTISTLFGKNVDAQLYVNDTSNGYRAGDAYYEQEYGGSPGRLNDSWHMLNNGSYSTYINKDYVSATGYKRKISTGSGTVTWNSDDTVSFAYSDSKDYFNHLGEGPSTPGVIWSNGNVRQIGASKHAVYIHTTDNKLYMSGNATQMAGSYDNSIYYNRDTPYTGMREVLSGVIDIKSNYNGIAALMMDGTVKYAGNVGAVTFRDMYGYPSYVSVMNVPTKYSKTQYMYSLDTYLVTDEFVTLPGMNNITRIQLGALSVMGMNDNTGEVFGIGFNQGQFGWTDPYFKAWTGYGDNGQYTMQVQQTSAKLIPLLDARKIKDVYMYGAYSKVIQKDNTIWQLKGGGFQTHAPWQYYWAYCQHKLDFIGEGSYTKIGALETDTLFEIDEYPKITLTERIGESDKYYVDTGYTKQYDQTNLYNYTIKNSRVTVVKKDGTIYYRNHNDDGSITYDKTSTIYYNGIVPIYSLNTEDVVKKSYRENSDKIILYVSDSTKTEYTSNNFGSYFPMTGLTNNFMSFLNKNSFGIYAVTPNNMLDYIENKFSIQELSLRQLLNSLQDKHSYDTGNYSKALSDILAKYNNEENLNKYVIVDEDIVKYNAQFIDREKDLKKSDRWMYSHNPAIFKNDLGFISTNNQWIGAPITTFDKVGNYKTTYQVQDDPTKDSKFENYNLWSDQKEQLEIIAHRKPIANFTAKVPKEIIKPKELVTNFDDKNEISVSYDSLCNIQNNGDKNTKALNGRTRETYWTGNSWVENPAIASVTFNIPTNATDIKFQFLIKANYCDIYLNDIRVNGYNSYNPTNLSFVLSPGTYTLKLKATYKEGYNDRDDDWHDPVYGNFIIDNLKLTYDENIWVDGSASDFDENGRANVTYNNTSYDLDHTLSNEIARTLNALPDKGIKAEEWKWIDITPGINSTWQSGKLTSAYKKHIYLVSLRVQDLEGAWSKPHIVILGDNKIEKLNIDANPTSVDWTNKKIDVNVFATGGYDYLYSQWIWSKTANVPTFNDTNKNTNRNFNVNLHNIKTNEGMWYLHMKATDSKESAYNYRHFYKLDVTPPTINYNIDTSMLSVTDILSGVKENGISYRWIKSGTKLADNDFTGFTVWDTKSKIEKPLGNGWYLHVKAFDIAGNMGYSVLGVYNDPLMLVNFRITSMVNPPGKYSFPIGISKMPVNAKSGYRNNYAIDVEGKATTLNITVKDGTLKTIGNITLNSPTKIVGQDKSIWEFDFITPLEMNKGQKVYFFIVGHGEGGVVYNYNLEANFNGETLVIIGNALEDTQINRIH